jgi:sulfite reductase alpha subunit-like flavoprotein
LPINLDMAFSTKQRDTVYVQHLMRRRGAQLSRWLSGTARLCVCDAAEEHRDAGTASDYAR